MYNTRLFNCSLLLDGFYKLPMYHKIKHNWIETKQDCLTATTLSQHCLKSLKHTINEAYWLLMA